MQAEMKATDTAENALHGQGLDMLQTGKRLARMKAVKTKS